MKPSSFTEIGRTAVRATAAGCLVLLLAGCASTQHQRISTRQLLDSGPSEDVTLSPGDLLEIRFFYNPQLSTEQPVRPDGKIALQLIGSVMAAGKTPDQLRDELMALYRGKVEKTDINVIVRSFAARMIFVGGEVNDPGQQPMPGNLSALDAVMLAGGVNDKAELQNVIIIRHQDGQRYACAVDLNAAVTGAPHKPFYLHALDIVYVPPSSISNVNKWIDQHISKMIPTISLPIYFSAN